MWKGWGVGHLNVYRYLNKPILKYKTNLNNVLIHKTYYFLKNIWQYHSLIYTTNLLVSMASLTASPFHLEHRIQIQVMVALVIQILLSAPLKVPILMWYHPLLLEMLVEFNPLMKLHLNTTVLWVLSWYGHLASQKYLKQHLGAWLIHMAFLSMRTVLCPLYHSTIH